MVIWCSVHATCFVRKNDTVKFLQIVVCLQSCTALASSAYFGNIVIYLMFEEQSDGVVSLLMCSVFFMDAKCI